MPEEWLELAYINFDKTILHGRVTAGRDDNGVRREREVEQVLTDDQKEAVIDLNERHSREMLSLLRGFVVEQPTEENPMT